MGKDIADYRTILFLKWTHLNELMEEDLKAEVMVEDCLIVPVEEKQVEQSVDDGRIWLSKEGTA